MSSRCTLPADQRRETVAAWRESVLIDVCGPAEPDRHPAFAGADVYRGSAGAWSSGGVELTRPRHRRPVECRAFGRCRCPIQRIGPGVPGHPGRRGDDRVERARRKRIRPLPRLGPSADPRPITSGPRACQGGSPCGKSQTSIHCTARRILPIVVARSFH